MTKENGIFITFLKSFSLYIGYSLIVLTLASLFNQDVLISLFSSLISISIIYCIYRKKVKEDIKNFKIDFKNNMLKIIIISGIFIISEIIISKLLLYFNITSENQTLTEKYILDSPKYILFNVIIFTPILEEFVFRLPYAYCKSNKTLTYIIYSCIFALVHLVRTYTLIGLLYFIPYMLLALGVGFGFYKTNNILMSTMIHILNNLIAVMLILL